MQKKQNCLKVCGGSGNVQSNIHESACPIGGGSGVGIVQWQQRWGWRPRSPTAEAAQIGCGGHEHGGHVVRRGHGGPTA